MPTLITSRRLRSTSLLAALLVAEGKPRVEKPEPGSKSKYKLVYENGYVKYVNELPPDLKGAPGAGGEDSRKEPKTKDPKVDKPEEPKPAIPFHPDEIAPTEELGPDQQQKFHQRLSDYRLDVVSKNPKRALDIATKIEKGISQSADICQMNPPICKQNKGYKRESMPQLLDESIAKLKDSPKESDRRMAQAAIDAGADPDNPSPLQAQFLEYLKKKGVKIHEGAQGEGGTTNYEQVPVGKLKATQSEIKADKTYGMADSIMRGFVTPDGKKLKDFTKAPIVVSRDNYILDGHHRWSSMLTVDPSMSMNVVRVDMDMDDILCESFNMPGVFRRDMDDNVIPNDAPSQLDCPQQKAAAMAARVARVFERQRTAVRVAACVLYEGDVD